MASPPRLLVIERDGRSKPDAREALAKSFDAEAARLKKLPKDAKVKKAYVDAGIKYEQKTYVGPNKLSPAVKYRATLALCRMVLAVDPKNPTCKKDMDQIVEIYTNSLHRPIPQ